MYDALAASLPEDYAGYHGVAWLAKKSGANAWDGEADFVIAHPERGVLVLEVKGGEEIRYEADPGKWYSRNVQGEFHTIKDPFEQARKSKYALLHKLKDLPALKGRRLPMAHAVCFPGVLKEHVPLRPDAPPEIVLDRADLDDPAPRIEAIFDFWQGQEGTGISTTEPLGPSGMDAVRRLLARSFELRTPLGREIAEEEREILRLSQGQFSLLDFLARHRRAAIHGGAGTGKTLLALEKARRLAAEGFRTLLTCYNVPLEAHLRASSRISENLTIQRFHTLCEEAARARGVPVDSRPPDHPDDAHWKEVLPKALLDALDAGFEKFDAIVVDEGQDIAEDWWTNLRLCLNDPDQGILYAFLDPGQLIYGHGGDFLDDLPVFELNANLRNTRQIHYLAQHFSPGHNLIPQGPEGRPPEIISLPETADLQRELGKVLHRLIREGQIPAEDIAILLGRRPESVGLPRTGSIGAFAITNALEPSPGKVILETIHRFKGMEAPAVILTGLEGMHSATAETLLYVGITRAKGHLVVMEKAEVLEKWGLGPKSKESKPDGTLGPS